MIRIGIGCTRRSDCNLLKSNEKDRIFEECNYPLIAFMIIPVSSVKDVNTIRRRAELGANF